MTINVQDLLDYAQINADKFKKNTKKFSIKELVNNVIEMQMDKAKDQNIDLIYEIQNENEFKDIVETDQGRLLQVMLGLQSNALKFTR